MELICLPNLHKYRCGPALFANVSKQAAAARRTEILPIDNECKEDGWIDGWMDGCCQ